MKLRDFLYIQKSDRIVMFVLLAVISIAIAFFFVVGSVDKSSQLADVDSLLVDSMGKRGGQQFYASRSGRQRYYSQQGSSDEVVAGELFPFDPNTADSTQLLKLGLKDWQVRNIYKYRERGGVYSKPEDFARVYGITVKQYRALEPYIRISPDYRPASTLYPSSSQGYARSETREEPFPQRPPRDTLLYPKKLAPNEHISLNTTDTTQLKKVPGIGSGFARAIVAYGDRLGGYYSVLQLMEIRNFPEQALDYFVVGTPKLRKINVNKLKLEQLRKHPYITFHMAKAIMDYRRLNGNLKSLEDLHLLPDFTPEVISRLNPYVEF